MHIVYDTSTYLLLELQFSTYFSKRSQRDTKIHIRTTYNSDLCKDCGSFEKRPDSDLTFEKQPGSRSDLISINEIRVYLFFLCYKNKCNENTFRTENILSRIRIRKQHRDPDPDPRPCFMLGIVLPYFVQDKTYHMVDKAEFGDWFILYLISRNMDTIM